MIDTSRGATYKLASPLTMPALVQQNQPIHGFPIVSEAIDPDHFVHSTPSALRALPPAFIEVELKRLKIFPNQAAEFIKCVEMGLPVSRIVDTEVPAGTEMVIRSTESIVIVDLSCENRQIQLGYLKDDIDWMDMADVVEVEHATAKT